MVVSKMSTNSTEQSTEDLANKCATMGCHGTKYEGDFCIACLAQKPWKPLVQRRCDNLTSVADNPPS